MDIKVGPPSPRVLLLSLDILAAGIAAQILLDRPVLYAVSHYVSESIVLFLQSLPGDTTNFGLICTFGLMIFVLYRAMGQQPLVGDRGIFIFGSCMLALTATDILKGALGRARPSLLLEHGTYAYHFFGGVDGSGYDSFPSSHAAVAFAAAAALSAIFQQFRWIAFGVAVAIGLIRVLAEVHFVSDVLVGASLGIASVYAVEFMYVYGGIRIRPEQST